MNARGAAGRSFGADLGEVAKIAWAVVRVRALGAHAPVFVSWAVTHRCNCRCQYCRIWEVEPPELDTNQALSVIDELAGLGTVRLGLTGGEPLLREDLGVLLHACERRRVRVNLNTNGRLLPSRQELLEQIASVTLSLDGPESGHDATRGAGSYREVLEAAECVRRHGRRLSLTTVLTRKNVEHVDHVLDVARRLGASASFHPMFASSLLWPDAEAPLQLDPRSTRSVFRHLIDVKRREPRLIRDSTESLHHLARWPEPTAVPCYAGRLFFRMAPDGRLKPCEWGPQGAEAPALAPEHHGGIAGALRAMDCFSCTECWNPSVVTFNHATGLTAPRLLRRLFRSKTAGPAMDRSR